MQPVLSRRRSSVAAVLLTLAVTAASVSLPSGIAVADEPDLGGTVTAGGFPAAAVEVIAVPAGSDVLGDGVTATTTDDGTYSFADLDPSGSYSLRFEDPLGRFVDEMSDGTALYAVGDGYVADPVSVGSTVDHELTATGLVFGAVGGIGGGAVRSLVTAYTAIPYAEGSRWVRLAEAATGADGSFLLEGIDPRVAVRLGFSDETGAWLATVYGSGRVAASAEALLGEGADVRVGDEPVHQTLISSAERAAVVPKIGSVARVGVAIALVNPPIGEYDAQWSADGVPIAGATSPGYTPTPAQVGKRLTLEVTVLDVNGQVVTRETSAGTSPVARGTFVGKAPVISGADAKGTIRFGTTLTAVVAPWRPATKVTYQWFIDGWRVSGAVSPTWKVTASAVGRSVSVRVTGAAPGYDTLTLTSAATKKVVAATLTAPVPKIEGSVRVGRTVSVKTFTWTKGTALSVQWYANGKAIAGATRTSLGIGPSLAGASLTVRVTGRLAGYTSVTRVSPASKVGLGTLTSSIPVIRGTAKVGQTLTAVPGSWTAGTKLRYQWYLNGAAVGGATSATFKVGSSSWVGKTVTVRVDGSKAGYAPVARTSAKTRAILSNVVPRPSVTDPISKNACPSWAPIKGNRDSMIYHLPGQRYYNVTNPEQCFASESAAKSAGYRRAKV